MKCPNCGAEIENTQFCGFCGSQITVEMQKQQEQLNKQVCPRCGSTNISYRRENQGEFRDKNSKTVVHRTVGVCKDCGNTWFADSGEAPKRKTWLWVLGWIFIFPLPLTLILVKKKDMNNILKYGLIALAWIVYIIIAFSGGESGAESKKSPTFNDTSTTSSVTTTEKSTTKESTTKKATAKKKPETTTAGPKVTMGELNALKQAERYLDYSGFSEKSLRDQLDYEGFSSDEIDYAIKNCNANWNQECAEKAQDYLDMGGFSRQRLYEQLEFEGFTSEQIEYGLAAVGY